VRAKIAILTLDCRQKLPPSEICCLKLQLTQPALKSAAGCSLQWLVLSLSVIDGVVVFKLHCTVDDL